MKLIDYMRLHNLRPEDVADLVGEVSASGVRKWASGERIPRKDQIEKIAEVTAGEVMPNDFFTLPAIETPAAPAPLPPLRTPGGENGFCREAAE